MEDWKAGLATQEDLRRANIITNKTEAIAIVADCGISTLYTELVIKKIIEDKVVVAITEHTIWVGFFYNTVSGNGEITHAYKVYRIWKV